MAKLFPGRHVRRDLHAFIRTGAILLFASSLAAQSTLAHACRGYRNWSTGQDVNKLKPGGIVVRAKFLASYKGEQAVRSIMGLPYGIVYHIQILDLVGSADPPDPGFSDEGAVGIFIFLRPHVCEQYYPGDFVKDAEKTLVLKMGAVGLYELVGGEESRARWAR